MLEAKEGEADALAGILRDMTPPTMAEPKVKLFLPYRSPTNPNLFFVFKLYVDEFGLGGARGDGSFQGGGEGADAAGYAARARAVHSLPLKESPMIEISTPTVPAFAEVRRRNSVPASPVVRAGDWVYVSGLAPVNPETGGYDILPIDQQARRSLEHLKSCLEAAGSALDRVVKCNVYCSNPATSPTSMRSMPSISPRTSRRASSSARRAGSVRSIWSSTASPLFDEQG